MKSLLFCTKLNGVTKEVPGVTDGLAKSLATPLATPAALRINTVHVTASLCLTVTIPLTFPAQTKYEAVVGGDKLAPATNVVTLTPVLPATNPFPDKSRIAPPAQKRNVFDVLVPICGQESYNL